MRYRISLLTFLVAVVIVGAVAGLIGRRWRADRARESLKTCGARVLDIQDIHAEASYRISGHGDVLVVANFVPETSPQQLEQILALARQVPNWTGVAIVDSPSAVDIADLTAFRQIRLLEITGPLEVAGFEHLPRFARLEQLLLLNNSTIRNVDLSVLDRCRALRSLDVSGTGVTDDGLVILGRTRGLRELRLKNSDLSTKSFLLFGHCQDLEILDVARIRGFVPLDSTPSSISRLLDLSFVNGEFRRYVVGNVDADDPPSPPHVREARFPVTLTWLDASGWDFSLFATETLTRLPELEYINLAGHSLDNEELQLLSRCAALRRVGLANTNIDDDALLRLVTPETHFEALDIRGTAVTTAGIEKLRLKPDRLYLLVGKGAGRFSIADLEAIMRCFPNKQLYLEGRGKIMRDVEDLAERYPLVKCHIRENF